MECLRLQSCCLQLCRPGGQYGQGKRQRPTVGSINAHLSSLSNCPCTKGREGGRGPLPDYTRVYRRLAFSFLDVSSCLCLCLHAGGGAHIPGWRRHCSQGALAGCGPVLWHGISVFVHYLAGHDSGQCASEYLETNPELRTSRPYRRLSDNVMPELWHLEHSPGDHGGEDDNHLSGYPGEQDCLGGQDGEASHDVHAERVR
mmetsp:Transcript_10259/g.24239  ORF Transcript_10259/g.24239 Transcript_10259/m.24239 type:complete len:201 (-) Transcript_10259:614-1216(-)